MFFVNLIFVLNYRQAAYQFQSLSAAIEELIEWVGNSCYYLKSNSILPVIINSYFVEISYIA